MSQYDGSRKANIEEDLQTPSSWKPMQQIELFACGFNAHGQLSGHDLPDDAVQDLHRFQGVLKAVSNIRVLFAGWADTLLDVDGQLRLYGFSGHGRQNNREIRSDLSASDISVCFGDHTGLKGVLTEAGAVYLLRRLDEQVLELQRHRIELLFKHRDEQEKEEGLIQHIAVAGNGRVCVSVDSTILEFPSLNSFLDSSQPTRHTLPGPPTHLLSGETSFTAVLSQPTPTIYTWGDARHNHLGRVITPDSPSGTPQIVDHLGGIPIRKVSAAGWITAAVSTSNDLYLWGGRPGEKDRIKALPDVSRRSEDDAEVKLVDLDDDVLDVAVGAGHVVALTVDGRVWTVGRGQNGQLGCGDRRDFVDDWIEVDLGLEKGQKVEAVHCGPWASFLVVRNDRIDGPG
ncbi:MAG: hypothetical protein M1816_006201 [Peltula sp. TS41687]|nr:MAG: hypothetical protein M1816_006201 [Peltula sp. TS41687]